MLAILATMATIFNQAVSSRVESSQGYPIDLSNLTTRGNALAFRETQHEPEMGQHVTSSWPPMQRLVTGIAIVAGFVGIYSIWPATESKIDGHRALELDQWQAQKEFIEYCVSIAYTSPGCDELETASIDPPPNLTSYQKNPGTSILSILLITLSIAWLVYFTISPFLVRKWLDWRGPESTDCEQAASNLVQYLQSNAINHAHVSGIEVAGSHGPWSSVEVDTLESHNVERPCICNTRSRRRKTVRFEGNSLRNESTETDAVDDNQEAFELDGSSLLPSLDRQPQGLLNEYVPLKLAENHYPWTWSEMTDFDWGTRFLNPPYISLSQATCSENFHHSNPYIASLDLNTLDGALEFRDPPTRVDDRSDCVWDAKFKGVYDNKISGMMRAAFPRAANTEEENDLLESYLKREYNPSWCRPASSRWSATDRADRLASLIRDCALPSRFSHGEKTEILEWFLKRRHDAVRDQPETEITLLASAPLEPCTSSADIPIMGGIGPPEDWSWMRRGNRKFGSSVKTQISELELPYKRRTFTPN